VRELRNILFIAATHNGGGEINDKTVAEVLQVHAHSQVQHCPSEAVEVVATPVAPVADTSASLHDVEAQHISRLLQQHNNNRKQVAAALGVSERTLYRKLKRYALT
jgi:two-component system response regulator AtoC